MEHRQKNYVLKSNIFVNFIMFKLYLYMPNIIKIVIFNLIISVEFLLMLNLNAYFLFKSIKSFLLQYEKFNIIFAKTCVEKLN